jgi:hypothetical protein
VFTLCSPAVPSLKDKPADANVAQQKEAKRRKALAAAGQENLEA